jgi:hypothetical protein
MKSNISQLILLFFLVLNSTTAQDNFEPNNTITNAATLDCEQFYQPFIQELGDQDWFKVDMQSAGALSAEISNVSNSLDIDVSIWQLSNGQSILIANDDDTNAGGGQSVTVTAFLEPGIYYIRVVDELDNSFNDSESYGLKISCYENNLEINQTIALASSISLDTCFLDNIWGENQLYFDSNNGSTDQDWFRVQVEESGTLDIAITFVPSTIDINLEIWTITNGQPKIVADDDDGNSSGGQSMFSTAYLEPGTYYVYIYDELNNSTTSETYNFCSRFIPNNEEINQTIDLASTIPQDTCFEDNIWGENELYVDSNTGDDDQDWFKVEINNSGYLSAVLTSVPAQLDLNVEILTKVSGQIIKLADDDDNNASGGQDLITTAYINPGTYYIHISDELNNFTTEETYNFCLSFFENELEVNQTISLASPIPVDTCFQENIWGENEMFLTSNEGDNDRDWFKVEVPAACELKASVTDVPLSMDINIELYQIVNGQTVLRSNDSDGTAAGGQDIDLTFDAEQGTYYILVEDENNNFTTDEYFTFCVSCLGTTSIEKSPLSNISIYPNPAHDYILLEGQQPIGSRYQIINSLGTTVVDDTISESHIQLSNLVSGIYYLIINDNSTSKRIHKFVKI